MEYKLDATEQKLGRLATKIAGLLMGKDKTDFERNKVSGNKVTVENVSKLDISKKKIEQTGYNRYSGYPGGRRTEKMKEVINKKGLAEVLRKAVRGMLPGNKLRPIMMKNLIIK